MEINDQNNEIQQKQDVTQQMKQQKLQLTKKLPSDRISFEKQITILRAYAILSGPNYNPVFTKDLSDMTHMHSVTISTANPFFYENGFIRREKGGYIPCQEIFEYHQALEWDAENAGQKLAPIIKGTWFAESLLKRLSFESLTEEKALAILAGESAASKEFKTSLIMLITYLEFSNLIRRENGMIYLNKQNDMPKNTNEQNVDLKREEKPLMKEPQDHLNTPAGGLSFSVNIKVSMNELSGWSPDRISKFFEGMAKVISAKSELDKNEKLNLEKEV